jgi:hypothetical protein
LKGQRKEGKGTYFWPQLQYLHETNIFLALQARIAGSILWQNVLEPVQKKLVEELSHQKIKLGILAKGRLKA